MTDNKHMKNNLKINTTKQENSLPSIRIHYTTRHRLAKRAF